jgi:hypothetical protein
LARSALHSNIWLAAILLCAAAALFGTGCDKGLSPIYEETGFEGVIHYSHWPAADQVRELRLLVFDFIPADSTNLVQILLNSVADPGHVVLYPTLGTPGLVKNVDATPYKLTTSGSTLQARQYKYIVLAQRYGPNSFADWKPAGVYTMNQATFQPAPLLVRSRRLLENIDIYVDFSNPPPKPWH